MIFLKSKKVNKNVILVDSNYQIKIMNTNWKIQINTNSYILQKNILNQNIYSFYSIQIYFMSNLQDHTAKSRLKQIKLYKETR